MADDHWEQRALLIATRLSDAADELRELISALRADPSNQLGPEPDKDEEGPDAGSESRPRDRGDR